MCSGRSVGDMPAPCRLVWTQEASEEVWGGCRGSPRVWELSKVLI